MKCPICHNSGRPMYCSHCMNTSPNLLIRLRIDLFKLRDTNMALKGQVEAILEYGLNRVEQQSMELRRKSKIESRNTEGDILGKRLLKLDLLRLRKKNNRIKYRISQEQIRITEKKRTKALKQEQLQIASERCLYDISYQEGLRRDKNSADEVRQQLVQIEKVVASAQQLKSKNLMEWFIIRKRDSYEFPYSLAFQPIVSLKNFYKLPSMVAWSSLSKMSQYITLISKILLFELPCVLGEPPREFVLGSENREDPIIDEGSIAEYMAKLVNNILQLSRHLDLLSQDPQDLVWLLDQYDLDTLFYNLITNQRMKSRPISHPWTYKRVLGIVSEALQLSVYAESPASRPTLAGTLANNTDKWYLVG